MSVLLDTHTFFWWITGSDRLPNQHRVLLETTDEMIYVSAVTGWEMAIKVKLGKWPDAAALIQNWKARLPTKGSKRSTSRWLRRSLRDLWS